MKDKMDKLFEGNNDPAIGVTRQELRLFSPNL